MTWRVEQADCVEAMRGMAEASVDAICTDPPYGLEFMGKEWDRLGDVRQVGDSTFKEVASYGAKVRHGGTASYGGGIEAARAQQEWHQAWATEALRVLRPGGHLLAFGGTRTYHRLTCAIEDAGFEIRDSVIWLYGSGFPKSLDVSKAIDKAAGAEREVVGKSARHVSGKPDQRTEGLTGTSTFAESIGMGEFVTAPATPEAEKWNGWGTALKPAHEPIVVARKPLSGTVAANVQAHGTGALNIDGCRIESGADYHDLDVTQGNDFDPTSFNPRTAPSRFQPGEGRWPANVTLSPEAAEELDRQSGELTSGNLLPGHTQGQGTHTHEGGYVGGGTIQRPYGGDTGGASRFFYVAKASRSERNAGLEGFEAKWSPTMGDGIGAVEHSPPDREGVVDGERVADKRNVHPLSTVKPIALMRWLCRLVTPYDGTILDPFTGSGTTGIAAVLDGFNFVGIERESEYAEIARARLEWWSKFPPGTDIEAALGIEVVDRVKREAGQESLFG